MYKHTQLWRQNVYNNANFKKSLRHVMHLDGHEILVPFLITKTTRRLFQVFFVQVTWPAKHGCGSKILKTFPMEQMWPSGLSKEARVSKIRRLW